MNLTTKLNKKEIELLNRLGFNVKDDDLLNLDEEEHGKIYDALDEHMFENCFDAEQILTKEGEVCEDIFYKLSEV